MKSVRPDMNAVQFLLDANYMLKHSHFSKAEMYINLILILYTKVRMTEF